VSVKKRCLNENTCVLFIKTISLKPSIFSLILFNSKVKSVTDDIAPVKVRKNSGRQKSTLEKLNSLQNMKRQCRRAERM